MKKMHCLGSIPLLLTFCIGQLLISHRVSGQPAAVGQWDAVQSWPVNNINIILLPNGKYLLWPRSGGNQARVWDPGNNSFTQVPLPTMNLFCAGHSFLADGTLLVTGGHIQDGAGERKAHIFDYRNNTWTRVADMNDGRWYPTTTTLGNGDALVSSGSIVNYDPNPVFQVWDVNSSNWRTLSSANKSIPLYPFMHLAPNGKVFNSGPNTTAAYLDTAGNGAWSATVGGRRRTFRDYGSSVQYAPGKIILIGGGDPPVKTAEVIDLNQANPSWRSVGSMAFARRQMNATLLPDGKIFVTGGTSGNGFNDACGAVFAAEMWDPATEQFTTLPDAAERRLYHSSAILMADGRVLTGGGGEPAGENCADAVHLNVQIYSPPYLFNGTRPALTSAPGEVDYGQVFSAGTSGTIAKAALIRLPCVTHDFDQNQMYIPLSFSQAGGTVTITTPASANICPPGHYMLFVINSTGVPSMASIIRVKNVLPPPPSAPTGLAAVGGPARVSLAWNAVPSASYNVKRSTQNGGPYSVIASLLASPSYEDSNVTPGTTYYYVVSASNSGGESPNSSQASATPTALSNGSGLTGNYFNNITLTAPAALTRVDPTVNFNWGNGSPGAGVNSSKFSVRWTGTVQAELSETYTFYTSSDDGARLWVNGVQLVSDWTAGGVRENSGSITLTAGSGYSIVMEYFDNTGSASAQLSWSSPSTPKQIIPQSRLFP
jgi:PA14 domain/Galactose oxidase-like, Early set domain/Glyoxal oxidase N-terminus